MLKNAMMQPERASNDEQQHAGCTEEEASQIIDKADIQFPLLAKPYYTDGRQGSHGLALVDDIEGLKRLVRGTGPPGIALPVMLQPFIDHGGCLFKVHPHLCSMACWACLITLASSYQDQCSSASIAVVEHMLLG